MMIYISFMFFSGIIVFSSTRKHLLLTLFSLEYLVVVLFFLMFNFLLLIGMDLYFILIFLTFSVCEGALGLGVLVNMIRGYGNDMLMSMSFLSW
uniref:NADH-ubiquinone oxidoreductase chain 4L n=1 Tax=Oxycarenus lugubris TaxID=2813423 RepID=A0A8U0A0R1_9HEMI|nr:NADH dehydrogenase subunit 4L [Oxycarenus lugubris]